MFDISEKRLAWIPVRWPGVRASDDEGLATNVEHEIECQVEIVDADRLREIFPTDADDDGPEPSPEEKLEVETEKFMALVRDWRGVSNAGASVPFTPDNVALVLRVPMFSTGFERSYIAAWTGQLEIRTKNSGGSSAGGRTGAKPKAKGSR